jgi:hypothetical protein
MKMATVICAMVICLVAAYGYAQMGEGMMGGMDEPGFGMPGQGMTGMTDMMPLMSQMADMMRKVSILIRRNLSPSDMKEVSDITADMSDQMMEMSRMMGSDILDPGAVQDLQWRMRETEDRLNRMR